MKRLLVTIALTCVLSGSAMAGTIPTMCIPGDVPSTDCSVPGDVHTGDAPGQIPTVGISALLTILDLAF